MIFLNSDGSISIRLKEDETPILAVCNSPVDCKNMVEESGWQADFSEPLSGLYHFDESVGVIRRLYTNPAALISALRAIV